jgi:hypothetical protein
MAALERGLGRNDCVYGSTWMFRQTSKVELFKALVSEKLEADLKKFSGDRSIEAPARLKRLTFTDQFYPPGKDRWAFLLIRPSADWTRIKGEPVWQVERVQAGTARGDVYTAKEMQDLLSER